ncbi:MAG: hypothetical protein Q8936_07345 [Bacillota bacterium]|nr:hypothetical protein [Bacillota bacterium]
MTNFRSLNSSKANMQSVRDHDEDAKTSMTEQVLERKEFAFNKFNVNGEKRRAEGESGH